MYMESSLAVCVKTATVTVSFNRERLKCSVLHTELVNVDIMEDLKVASGGAGQQAFSSFSHQPLAVVGSHVAGHMLFGPRVQPGMKASVQASVDPLLGLRREDQRSSADSLKYKESSH